MIQLTCTNCRATLVMDDAFAGGVCRCKHCGTIQTVPRPSRRAAAPGASGEAGQSKTLFQRPSGFGDLPGSGTGLDDLANVVASSGGLSGTGLTGSLRQKQPMEPTSAEPPRPGTPPKKNAPFIAAVIIGAMLFSALVTWLAVRDTRDPGPISGNGGAAAPAPGGSGASSAQPAAGKAANFLGIPISGRTVVYVLDRGSGTRQTFEMMKLAAWASLKTLPPDTRFQVIFWETDTAMTQGEGTTRPGVQGDLKLFPPDGARVATAANVAEARETLKDVYAYGQSRVAPAIRKAMANNPDEILLATGKYGLEPEVASAITTIRGGASTRIHTFSLGEAGSPDVLKDIAKRTGGQFREVSLFDLRQATE